MRALPQAGEVWKHVKAPGEYRIITTAYTEKTGEACVVYASVDRIPVTWIRPLAEFMGTVVVDGGYAFRFERLGLK